MNNINFNELLIKEVRKYKCLYDVSLKDYRNLQKKDMIWETVAKTLKTNSESCKRRWKTLRDMYKKKKRATKLASSNRGHPPEKKWKLQEALSFLDKCKDPRTIFENVEIIKKDPSNFAVMVKSQMTQDFENSRSEWMPNTETSNDMDLQSSSSRGMPSPPSEKPIKQRANDEMNDAFTEAVYKFVASINELAKVRKRNSTSILFESFAQKITDANLSKADVNKIETKVISLVYHELSKYNRNKV